MSDQIVNLSIENYHALQEELLALRQQVINLQTAKFTEPFQIARQKTLLNVIGTIRSSLNLEKIFKTTVTEIRHLLNTDRVGIFCFDPDSNHTEGKFVSEDVRLGYLSVLQHKVCDRCFGEHYANLYAAGELQAISDIYNAGLTQCHIDILSQFQIRANLVLPILLGEELWGLLCIHQCSGPRQWQDEDIEFMLQIAIHLGVAVQQSKLLTQTQQQALQLKELNQALDEKVQQATTELLIVNQVLQAEIRDRKQQEAQRDRIAKNLSGAIFQFTSRAGVWQVDYISEGIYELAGITATEMMADFNCFMERVHPEDLNDYIASVVEVLEQGKPWYYEGRLVKPNGEISWWQGNSTPTKNENGEILFCGVLLDISDRKQTQFALKQSEEQLRLFVEHAPAAVAMFDSDMRYLLVSRRWKEDYGLGGRNILGCSHYEIFPDVPDHWKQIHQRCLAGASEKCEEDAFERADGSVEWVKWEILPWYRSDGTIGGLVMLTETITARKKVEEQLRQLNEELEARVEERTTERDRFFSLSHDLLCITSINGDFKRVNPAFEAVLGYGSEKLLSTNFLAFVHPEDQAETLAEITQLTQGISSSILFENRYRCQDGSYKWLSWNAVFFSQGQTIYATARDISDRKAAEILLTQQAHNLENTLRELQNTQAQLVQNEKMSSLGQLVAGIAHEINNPVNFIYGNLVHTNEYIKSLLEIIQTYQEAYPDPIPEIQEQIEVADLDFLVADLPKMLSSMQIGANRIREIVLSLRNFSRLDEAECKPVDIHEGIESTLTILHNRLKPKHNAPGIVTIKEYGNLPLVDCYAGQLNQVFMNILVNAIDALEERDKARSYQEIQQSPSSIFITTEFIAAQKEVQIKIQDNGPGIPENIQKYIFDPFFTTKELGKGTGLGMTISYQIVNEKHRGNLKCLSSPETGTAFIIQIPIQQNYS